MDHPFIPLITLGLTFPEGYNIGKIVAYVRAQNMVGIDWRPITGNKFEIFAQISIPGDTNRVLRSVHIIDAFTKIAKRVIHEYPGTIAEIRGDAHFIFSRAVQLKM